MTLPAPPGESQAPLPDLIPGILSRGSLNILAGASGVGKTCLLATFLSKLVRGDPIFGLASHPPAKIGYICADRGGNVAKHWLAKAGNPPLVFYSLVDDPNFLTARLRNKFKLVETLDAVIAQLDLPWGSLVVVDPVTLFFGNPNDYQACAIACIELRRAINRRGLTLIGTAHAGKQKVDNKAKYARLQDRILGSAAQLGYGDTQMYLAAPEETGEKHHTFLWHPHTAPPQLFALGRDQDGMFVDWFASSAAQEEAKILAVLPSDEDGIAFAEIVLKSEVSRATVHRYLQDLLKDGRVLKVGHGRWRKAPAN